MDRKEVELIDMSKQFLERYLKRSDYDILMAQLSKDITWIGKGDPCIGIPDVKRYFGKELPYSFKDIKIEEYSYELIYISEDILVISMFVIEPKECLSLRCTLVWKKENVNWKILHGHVSTESITCDEFDSSQYINEQLKSASRTDSVTNLNNMEGFCDNVEKILLENSGKRYALIKFGIKDFRYINQRHGYSMGDKVLQNIGKNLRISCIDEETCGRIEKDTFAILYRFKGKRNMSNRIDKLNKMLVDRKLLTELGLEINFVAGIYIIPKVPKGHVKDMLDKALMAQQQVKRHQQGNHYLFYEDRMMEKQLFINQILSYAPTALEKEEFQLYIQPQFDVVTGKVIAGEALCRWEKEKETFIPPNEFIPLFEEYGLILSFDFLMLKKLCQKMQEWIHSDHIITPISINQSRLHIETENYIENFCKVVDQYAIPHHYIAFELTESAFVAHYEKMIQLANELHKKGFQLAIDDFGTGFASLNLLSVISADILKIDKSLVDNIDTKRGRAVLQKVIELAHQMDMSVICEGIEQMEQLKQLRELGCDIGQGYLVGRPIPASEFEKIWIMRKG